MDKVKFTSIKLDVAPKVDTLTVNKNKGKIALTCLAIRFKDKDTLQTVLYVPCLDITGYGATLDKAKEMLDFSLKEFFTHLLNLSINKITDEIDQLGWKHNPLKRKVFNKSYIDLKEEIQNFNALDNKVEIMDITAAA